MKGKETKHVKAFRESKLKPGETVVGHLEGWIGEIMGGGDKTQHNGQFMLTNMRACFYRKGFVGEVFDTIPLENVTSIETLSRMGYHVLRLHTSHDELAFKTLEEKELFDQIYESLEASRGSPIAEQIKAGDNPIDTDDDLKTCPYCAETIKKNAILCRYCKSELDLTSNKEELEPEKEQEFRCGSCGVPITKQLEKRYVGYCAQCWNDKFGRTSVKEKSNQSASNSPKIKKGSSNTAGEVIGGLVILIVIIFALKSCLSSTPTQQSSSSSYTTPPRTRPTPSTSSSPTADSQQELNCLMRLAIERKDGGNSMSNDEIARLCDNLY